jgi:transposase
VGERGRFSARRKREAVLRLLGGASLEELSRELGVMGARLSQWREAFLDGGTQNLKSRSVEAVDDGDRQKLQAKVGELTMEIELLYKKVEILEGGRPLATRRSRR